MSSAVETSRFNLTACAATAVVLLVVHLIFFTDLSAIKDYIANKPFTTSTAANNETLPSEPKQDADISIAFCSSVRDQSPDMPEWFIHHYYNIGINAFYVMDDGSHPPLSDFDVDNYYGIPSTAITFSYFNEEERSKHGLVMQEFLNDQCNRKWGSQHDWIAYVDVDEFIGLPGNETLQDILRPLTDDPDVGAVGVHWLIHTSSGHLHRQASVRQAFTECNADPDAGAAGLGPDEPWPRESNEHVKSLVKPSLYGGNASPHNFHTLNGSREVDVAGRTIDQHWKRPVERDRVALHHYMVKSKEEYAQKLARGNQGNLDRGWEFWDYVEGFAKETCLDMTEWEV